MRQIEVPLDAAKPIVDVAHALIHTIKPIVDVVHALIHTIKPILDAGHAFIDTIKPAALNCDLRLHVAHLCHHVSKGSFKPGDSSLEVSDVGAHLVLPALKCFDSAPQQMQLLHDKVSGFVGHKFNLVWLRAQIYVDHSASAPEMISISSLVIIAWRVRL